MTSTIHQTPRPLNHSSSWLRLTTVLLAAATSVAAQSRIVRPTQSNTNSVKRPNIATVRSSDSAEGSRVAISSNQSLNDYEAYRRGDRFYVKIPAADVPRAEAVRGRGFADVKAQRSGDSTILSFRLQPGSTAHVEQRGNKLDVVVAVPGGNPVAASNRTRDISTPNSNATRSEPNRRTNTPVNSSQRSTNKNPSDAGRETSSNSRGSVAPQTSRPATPSPTVAPAVTKASPTPKPTASPAKPTNAIAAASPQPAPGQPPSDWWARLKERGRYWLLLAQLNPVPVGIGAALLLLVIGLLVLQRRRARGTRRTRSAKIRRSNLPAAESTPAVAAADDAAPKAESVVVAEPAAVTDVPPEAPPIVPIAAPAPVTDNRRDRVSRASEEARKLFAGEAYDESVLGSEDRETRRLVGAELSAALVGRNAERRERARAAFMQYGYFDDATRDLRVAHSENERAAAARRLSFVQDREATPHLIGALSDPSPDVRRAAIEALTDLRDPAAIPSLNSLMQHETDRKVPRSLIQQAIEACATAAPQAPAAVSQTAPSLQQPATPAFETEREVIEL